MIWSDSLQTLMQLVFDLAQGTCCLVSCQRVWLHLTCGSPQFTERLRRLGARLSPLHSLHPLRMDRGSTSSSGT